MMDYYTKTILGIKLPLVKGKTQWGVLLEGYVCLFWESWNKLHHKLKARIPFILWASGKPNILFVFI